MKLDCLLAGVGGQGTVLASKMLAQAAVDQGFFARTSETIGMAQRGGSVTSHVRLGEENCSPAIGRGKADLLIGFEPAEAVRSLDYLKESGVAVMNIRPVVPVTSSLGGGYQAESMLAYIRGTGYRHIFVDGGRLCCAAGSAKVLNVIMLGVLFSEGLTPFAKEIFMETLKANLPKKFVALNLKAFEIGCNYKNIQGGSLNEEGTICTV